MLTLDYTLASAGILVTVISAWLIWSADHRPKSDNTCQEVYVDDSSIRKVEILSCKLDWGTRWFPFKHMKLVDVAVSSSVLVRYTPQAGLEKDLPQKYFREVIIKKTIKPIKLCQKSFFANDSISHVRIHIYTPFERQKYAVNIKHEIRDNILRVWNENAEEIRNFRLQLSKPVTLSGIEVLKGTIASVELDIAYQLLNRVVAKQIGTVNNDVAMALLLNLPPKSVGNEEQIVVRLAI